MQRASLSRGSLGQVHSVAQGHGRYPQDQVYQSGWDCQQKRFKMVVNGAERSSAEHSGDL